MDLLSLAHSSNAYKADKLRVWLSENSDVREIIDFRNRYIFKDAGITTAIVSLTKSERVDKARFYRLLDESVNLSDLAKARDQDSSFRCLSVPQEGFGSGPWLFADAQLGEIIEKIDAAGEPLASFLKVGQGMQTGDNKVFGGLEEQCLDDWGVPEEQRFIRARNSDIHRYHIRNSGEFLLYPENLENFDDLPQGARAYLLEHETALKSRAAFKRGNCKWWRYTWPLHKESHSRRKLYCPYLATRNRFALDERNEFLGLTDTTVVFDSDQKEDLFYIMALLNSRLLTLRFRYIGKLKSGGIIEYFENTVGKIPIRRIDFGDSNDAEKYRSVLEASRRMTELQEELADAATDHHRSVIQHQIDATDRMIDTLVYGLYGITADEIDLVEAELQASV